MVEMWKIKLFIFYVSHKLFCINETKDFKVIKKMYIFKSIIKLCYLWINVFGIGIKQWHSNFFSSNDLKFDMFVYYTCVDF
jgi:hypothetical protein